MNLVRVRFVNRFQKDLVVTIDNEQLSRFTNFLEDSVSVLMFTVSDVFGPKKDIQFGYGGYTKWVESFPSY